MPLIRQMARTAAVAGTATAVSNRVSRRQQGRWAQQEAADAYQQQAAAPAAPQPAAAGGGEGRVQQLKDLADLKSAGALTDEEFAAEKARLLNT